MLTKCAQPPSRISWRLQIIRVVIILVCFFLLVDFHLLPALVAESRSSDSTEKVQSLFLLQGCPYTDGPVYFPTMLYKLQRGKLCKVRDVLEQGNGSSFIRDYHDQRIILIKESFPVPKAGESKFHLIWMDEPEKVDQGLLKYDPSKTEIEVYLVDLPQKGLTLCSKQSASNKRSLTGFILKDKAGATLQWEDFAYVIIKGAAGLRTAGNDRLDVSISKEGMPFIYDGDLEVMDLKLKRAGGLEEIAQKYARLFVSNAYMAALAPTFDRGELKGRTNMGVWVLEKSTGKWIKRNFPTGLGGFRAFGPWMAGYAVESNLDLNRLSPGHEARKAHSTKCCIPLDERIAEDDVYLPGRLILFNIHSQKTIEIPTGDADSEVILITDNRICYRVGRKLFEATISADGITEVKTLLADDLVQDIHWAFFK